MHVHVHKTAEMVVAAYARHFVDLANSFLREQGFFNVVLSGGSSPKKVFTLLASLEYSQLVDWQNVYFFFGDERYVPTDHAESNAKMAKDSLLEPLGIDDDHVFEFDTTLAPAAAAEKYEQKLSEHFAGENIHFDLCMLGLGDDGHTASLFPNTSILHKTEAGVRSVYLDKKGIYRLSMTAPLINQSKHIAFLAYGKAKADAVQLVIKGKKDTQFLPAQLISPIDGELNWFLDSAAAEQL